MTPASPNEVPIRLVSHQYCGALGKRANCQVAVTHYYTSSRGHVPLAVRLHLPESWTTDAQRMDAAGVPEDQREPRAKGPIALELLDRVRAEEIAGGAVLADTGYGNSNEFRDGPATRGCTTSSESRSRPSCSHNRRAGCIRNR